jgi:hypothetical protein
MATPVALPFPPGLYSNRTRRASRRFTDGNLVRFPDGYPEQMGGWTSPAVTGVAIAGRARDMVAWRVSTGRMAAIGTNEGAFSYDGGTVKNITPAGFVAGRPDSLVGVGFGAGLYGGGTYGTPRALTGITSNAASWTLDLWGTDLVACYTDSGKIYDWTPGVDETMQLVANAPTCRAIVVSDERHLFAIGTGAAGDGVDWSDQENNTVWTPTATNKAGGYTLAITSPFQCGRRVRGQVLAWTQTELFGFAPLTSSLVYSRDRLGTNCGVAGPQAACVVTDNQAETAYWMGVSNFYAFDGVVRTLPCDLHEYVFGDLNTLQRVKFHARPNTRHNEVWFFYCSAASNEIDRAVVFDYQQGTWTKAALSRLVWCDAGVYDLPLAIDATGTIYQHEDGETADGQPMPSFITSPLLQANQAQVAHLLSLWPDMEAGSGTMALTITGRFYPHGEPESFGPYLFDGTTTRVELAVALREFQLKFDAVAGHWALGEMQIEMQGGGLR